MRGPGRLVLPEGEQPEAYDWTLCSGLVLVVSWPAASEQEVYALGELLVCCGATAVLALEDVIADLDAGRNRVLRPFRRYVRAA